jgi:hypothetical protein
MSERTQAKAQGYLSCAERPQCSNCWASSAQPTVKYGLIGMRQCTYGGFAVSPTGWCAIWVPTAEWIDANPDAATKLGLRLGIGPVEAAA